MRRAQGVRTLLAALVPDSARRVLEIGCGAGLLGAAIKRRLPGCRVYGIETDRARGADAARRLDAVVSDTSGGLPFDVPFDAIVVPDALGHLDNPAPLLHGIVAMLAPDAPLIAAAPVAANFETLARARSGTPGSGAEGQRRYTRAALLALMHGYGLDVTGLHAIPDPAAGTVRLPLDGARTSALLDRMTLYGLSAEELEDFAATSFVVTALRQQAGLRAECSIVIVAADAEAARACITALRASPPLASREIIIVLTRAGISAADGLVAGAHVLASRDGLSDAAARNLGARCARGEHLIFVDAAARPEPGWVDALLASARRAPGIGVVGSMRVHPDGRLAHAGVAFGGRDVPAQPLPYPLYRGERRDAPHVNRERRVSAVAGSGLAVLRSAFVAVGGFDQQSLTAYADVDLCLAVRSRGLAVVYCPASVIEEDETATVPHAAGEAAPLLARWTGLERDEDVIAHVDGTDLARIRGPLATPRSAAHPPVVWSGHFYEGTGYTEEARTFVLALHRAGLTVHANPLAGAPGAPGLPPALAEQLERLFHTAPPAAFVHVVHATPTARIAGAFGGRRLAVEDVRFRRHPRALRNVGRTMFETDRIPPEWVAPCNDMDEVWVPSAFNADTFARAGVARDKLFVVPGALPLPALDAPAPPLWDFSDFVFLSVFAWSWRKGWDVLLRAYVEEFHRDEPVMLLLHVSPDVAAPGVTRGGEIGNFMRQELGRDPGDAPPVAVLSQTLSAASMQRLFRTANAFVLPTRGEGFGRPYMEAMAHGVPAIGTNWGGQLDFMRDDNAYLIDATVADVSERMWRDHPLYRGHRWAEPSVAHLRTLMRRVFEERGEAAAKAARARSEILERHAWPHVAATMMRRLGLSAAPPRALPPAAMPLSLAWEGPQFVHFGMAVVNRGLCRELARADDIDLTLVTDALEWPDAPADAPLAERVGRLHGPPARVHVRHQWPPSFQAPPAGHWVMIQPWEFGAVPTAWIEPLNRQVDELWVPSDYVRTSYVRSGVDPRRVVVVPNGIDPARFRPDAPPRDLPTRKTFRFLFVGGTLWRKGADILLDVYLQTFRREDDVCLVVKDLGGETFYRGQTLRERLRALAADERHPEIVYLEEDLAEDDLPGLYTACQCLVHPYRGEGFALPIVEAMACGLAVVAPGWGPARELCTPETAYLVPVSEVALPAKRVGDLETVDFPRVAEIDRAALALTLREIADRPREARERGGRASVHARQAFTWSRAAGIARERVRALAARPVRRHSPAGITRRRELSVAMIVRDEEARLPACLASVRDVADELIVVDTGSVDRTIEVARAHGAVVVEAPWTDDWAAARNVSLEHATRDWILVIDGDQTLDAGSVGEVRRIIQHDAPVAFLLRQLNYIDGDDGASVVEHLTVRLFPNHPAIRYEGVIHEQVVSLAADLRLELLPSGVVLHHRGYLDPAGRRRKAERDRPLLEKLVAASPGDPFALYNLGVTYHTLERGEQAADTLRRAIDLAGPGPHGPGQDYLITARVIVAQMLIARGQHAEAAAVCREALAVAPGSADAWCTLGSAELAGGRWDAAADAYRRALGATGADLAQTDRATSGWKAWCGMGQAELARGRWDEALLCLERAVALAPRAPDVLRALEMLVTEARARRAADPRLYRLHAHLLHARGDGDGALACLQQALAIDARDPATLVATAGVLLDAGAAREAEDAYRAALTLSPGLEAARRGVEAARRRRG